MIFSNGTDGEPLEAMFVDNMKWLISDVESARESVIMTRAVVKICDKSVSTQWFEVVAKERLCDMLERKKRIPANEKVVKRFVEK